MSEFEYVIGFHTIVLGLATGRVLATLADVIRYRSSLRHFWVHTLWCVILQLMLVGWWYSLWRVMHDLEAIGYLEFVLGFSSTISLYLMASLLQPDIDEDRQLDLERYFFSVRVPLFLAFGYPLVAGALALLLPGGTLGPSATPVIDALSGIEFLAVVIVGLALKTRRAHEILVVLHGAFYLGIESLQLGIGS